MTDAAAESTSNGQPTVEPDALDTAAVAPGVGPAASPSTADERPELAVGAAFAGGLVLALFLKRLAR
jgi:hypothetical protein